MSKILIGKKRGFNMSCVIVYGFYRTGSSAVAGVLHHLGVFMGSQFDPPNNNNPQGYWEDLAFKNLHQAMLEGDNVEKEYIALIRQREQLPLWGVKDPLLCLLLPNLIDNLKTDYKIIHCTRTDQGCVDSLVRSTGGDRAFLERMRQEYKKHEVKHWSKYVARHERQKYTMHVPYEFVFHSTFVEAIAKFVGLPVTNEALSVVKKK